MAFSFPLPEDAQEASYLADAASMAIFSSIPACIPSG
jgi:hypothetical protein